MSLVNAHLRTPLAISITIGLFACAAPKKNWLTEPFPSYLPGDADAVVHAPSNSTPGLPSPIALYPARSLTDEPTPVDFESIPLANDLVASAPPPKFSLKRLDLSAGPCPPGSYATRRITWLLELAEAATTVVQIRGVTLPEHGYLDGTHDVPRLDDLVVGRGNAPAVWTTLERTGGRANVTEHVGVYDGESGVASAQSELTASPSALVDGVLYAFRRCSAHCNKKLGERDEAVTLIAPPAVWAGASDETVDHGVEFRAPFTAISTAVRPGSSATLEAVVLDSDVERFKRGLTRFERAWEDKNWTTFSLEVVWPKASAAPSVTLFVSHGGGSPAHLRPDAQPTFPEPEVSPPARCVERNEALGD